MHRTSCYESPRITSIEIGKFRVIIISHVSEDDTVFYIGPSSGSLSSERDNKGEIGPNMILKGFIKLNGHFRLF